MRKLMYVVKTKQLEVFETPIYEVAKAIFAEKGGTLEVRLDTISETKPQMSEKRKELLKSGFKPHPYVLGRG